jgi:hypothetical protein
METDQKHHHGKRWRVREAVCKNRDRETASSRFMSGHSVKMIWRSVLNEKTLSEAVASIMAHLFEMGLCQDARMRTQKK